MLVIFYRGLWTCLKTVQSSSHSNNDHHHNICSPKWIILLYSRLTKKMTTMLLQLRPLKNRQVSNVIPLQSCLFFNGLNCRPDGDRYIVWGTVKPVYFWTVKWSQRSACTGNYTLGNLNCLIEAISPIQAFTKILLDHLVLCASFIRE